MNKRMIEGLMWIWALVKAVGLASAVVWCAIKMGWLDWVLDMAVNTKTYYGVLAVVGVGFWGLVWVFF